ncbi:MAG: flagellar biosynthesis protein FliQ [Vallitaleaceae bacterium]|nr:flagellar biosynthesis protein FliQ [Vallitaleaceae bacterium]
MNEQVLMDFAQQAVLTTILASAPLLIIALVVGLVISIFQTVTSIQEQTLAFVPKIIAIFLGLVIFGPYMGDLILDFFVETMMNINVFIR